MSPFKEPQPRKNSAAEDAKTVIGGNWPPYARQGSEARWEEPKVSETPLEELTESQPPLRETTSSLDLTVRKAALEAACALQGNNPDNGMFWRNIGTLEEYLRHGTKPQ